MDKLWPSDWVFGFGGLEQWYGTVGGMEYTEYHTHEQCTPSAIIHGYLIRALAGSHMTGGSRMTEY